MKLYELKQIIKEEIYKELNEGIFSTTCTLDDLHKKIEEICRKQLRFTKTESGPWTSIYKLEKNDSENKIQVEVNYGNYRSNDLIFIQSGQNDENIYKKLEEKCKFDFQRFFTPLSKFCTGILKINRPGIIMYTQHELPVKKTDEKTNRREYYMYSVIADLYIGSNRVANYSRSKEKTNKLSSDDSVRSTPNIGYITFFLRS